MLTSSTLQCDETTPICQRCTKSRRICLGTDTANEICFSINVENSFASGKSKRPRGPRSTLTLMRPHFDLQTRATAYFVRYHLQELSVTPSITGGLFECVSAWKYSGRTCPQVDSTLGCLALAVYSRTQNHLGAARAASSTYYTALKLSQSQIARMDSRTITEGYIDACLLSSFLMGRYEGTTQCLIPEPEKSFINSRNWSHYDGILAILKIWHEKMGQQTPSTIVKYIRRQLRKFFLLRDLPLPDWILDGGAFGETGQELEYDHILVELVNLRYETLLLSSRNCCMLSNAGSYYAQASRLERALVAWIGQVPGSYQCQNLSKPYQWPLKHFYSPEIYTYTSIGNAAIWLEYFATRMLIVSVKLRLLDTCATGTPYMEQRTECVNILKDMGSGIASTVPFCLERISMVGGVPVLSIGSKAADRNAQIKPYLSSTLIWPLTVGSSLECNNVEQKQWFKSELAAIGSNIGDGLLEHAGTDQWITL